MRQKDTFDPCPSLSSLYVFSYGSHSPLVLIVIYFCTWLVKDLAQLLAQHYACMYICITN